MADGTASVCSIGQCEIIKRRKYGLIGAPTGLKKLKSIRSIRLILRKGG